MDNKIISKYVKFQKCYLDEIKSLKKIINKQNAEIVKLKNLVNYAPRELEKTLKKVKIKLNILYSEIAITNSKNDLPT